MNQTFEKVESGIYRREYATATGDSVLYYGRLKVKRTGNRELFALGPNLKEARDQFSIIKVKNRRGEDLSQFKAKPKAQHIPAARPMTVERWSEIYLDMEETKSKRSYERDCQLVQPLKRILGDKLLTELKREHLFDYRKQRLSEHIVRAGKAAKKTVSTGTVANELSCLRHMLKIAHEGEIETSLPSFRGLIVRHPGRERLLDTKENKAMQDAYPTWLKRVAISAAESCLSEGDIIRLTKPMIDRERREIVPAGGRLKTGVEQRAPLTDRIIQILDEIEQDKKSGKIVANINGLIFTRDDGSAITKDMITGAVRTARRRAKVSDFRFHDYRHVAQTNWVRQNIHVDIAMKGAGHKSVAMHQRYVNLKEGDVGRAFGLLEMVDTDGRHEEKRDDKERATS